MVSSVALRIRVETIRPDPSFASDRGENDANNRQSFSRQDDYDALPFFFLEKGW